MLCSEGLTKLPEDDLKRSEHVGVVLGVLKGFM